MRYGLFVIFSLFAISVTYGQELNWQLANDESSLTDSHEIVRLGKKDTVLVDALNRLSSFHKFTIPDSGRYYGEKALILSRELDYMPGELRAYHHLSIVYQALDDQGMSLRLSLLGQKLAEENDLTMEVARAELHTGIQFKIIEDFEESIKFLKHAYSLFKELNEKHFLVITSSRIGSVYLKMDEIDSAQHYCKESTNWADKIGALKEEPLTLKSLIFMELGQIDSSIFYMKEAFSETLNSRYSRSFDTAFELSRMYQNAGHNDSALYFADHAWAVAEANASIFDQFRSMRNYSRLYRNIDTEKSLEYSWKAMLLRDSIEVMRDRNAYTTVLEFDESQRAYELEKARREYRNEVKTEALSAGFLALLIIALLLYRNNRAQKKSKRKTEIAYDRLKNTQTQLIHSEKMASLGELTAGIAHEIQNPLNFVNNFSEVNTELVQELKEEAEKGDIDEVKAIASDIEDNEKKIAHHGKRAEGIVKSMLQHSRTGSGEKELTDINALCDEYLRLAYHGLRAKDQSFNADFKTDFDHDLPKVEVVPQDIGRVLLNLINNAFQAVSSQINRHSEPASPVGGPSEESREKEYENNKDRSFASLRMTPLVTVSTKKLESNIQITVSDNGPGIPDDIKDKIFQPFFTTKPTGEGTGLGLSMSYDIVTKGHGGEMKVETELGKGSKFVIMLPAITSVQ